MKKFSVITANNIIIQAPSLDKIVRVSRHVKFAPYPPTRKLLVVFGTYTALIIIGAHELGLI